MSDLPEKAMPPPRAADASPAPKSEEVGDVGEFHHTHIDAALQKSYLRKLDFYLLPFLSLMYLFNSVDRVSFNRALAPQPLPASSPNKILTIAHDSPTLRTPTPTASIKICTSSDKNTLFYCYFSIFRTVFVVGSRLLSVSQKSRDLTLSQQTCLLIFLPSDFLERSCCQRLCSPGEASQ